MGIFRWRKKDNVTERNKGIFIAMLYRRVKVGGNPGCRAFIQVPMAHLPSGLWLVDGSSVVWCEVDKKHEGKRQREKHMVTAGEI